MSDVKPFPVKADAPADERAASVIACLQDALVRARAGEYRSVAMVFVTSDGRAMPTSWNTASGDVMSLIGRLAVLQHDLMDEGRGA